jgi:hypothetical protein
VVMRACVGGDFDEVRGAPSPSAPAAAIALSEK